MKIRDTFDFLTSMLAVVCDAVALYAGFVLAVWIRFHSGWIPLFHEGFPPWRIYYFGAGMATLLSLLIFAALGLYDRPQYGHFIEKIPRIVRAVLWGILLAMVLAFILRTETEFSRIATAISLITVTLLVLVERNVLFQLERHWAKYQIHKKKVVILGTGPMAARLKHTLEREHRLRARPTGFFSLPGEDRDVKIPDDEILGGLDEARTFIQEQNVDEVVLTNPARLNHPQMVDLIMLCERRLAHFQMVPDIFNVLTSRVDMRTVNGIPLLGVGKWPLDFFHNRMLKRLEDVAGAGLGLVLSLPIMAVAGILIRLSSPGPVLYRQTRCGENGQEFTLLKLRTMRMDSEETTGPVWTCENDPRRTKIGRFLRASNLDELPQFWNVLVGQMSLVGPRPERPHFVEQFREDIQRYMWRHVSKPGMTGWAQVHGLRGNTSIQDRIKHDLFYLENWSLSLDFKILLKTLFSNKNAY